MDITQASPKFLFSLAKNFIASENITYEDAEISYYDSYDTTEYSDSIFKFLKERGFTRHRNDNTDKFFYEFIKQNKDYIFGETPITDYSVLVIPQIKNYKFNWEVTITRTTDEIYVHSHQTYLDIEDAEEEVRFKRGEGYIYYDDGRELESDTRNVEVDEDYITKFRRAND